LVRELPTRELVLVNLEKSFLAIQAWLGAQ
jgi:hypothetical protein